MNMDKIVLKELLEPYLPREHYDEEDIKKLAESIREHGLLDNIILNATSKGLKPIGGTRRLKALECLGVETIPSKKYPQILRNRIIILELSEEKALELAIVHNVQRKDLSGIEKANGYLKLMNDYNWTQERLAERIKKSQESISDKLRLLKLPDKVKDKIITHVISDSHGRILLSLKSLWKNELKSDKFCQDRLERLIQDFQNHLFEECLKNKWSTTRLAEQIEHMRFLFVRVRLDSRIEKDCNWKYPIGEYTLFGKPAFASDLCELWGLDEDSNDLDDSIFFFKYADKYGLRPKEDEEEIVRNVDSYDIESDLERQIEELEEQLELIRMEKKLKGE